MSIYSRVMRMTRPLCMKREMCMTDSRNIFTAKNMEYMTTQKERYMLIFFFAISFLLRIFYISKLEGPFVYTDELGYWGHAANLTGHNWAGVMNNMPWYAFWYSLLLAPFFLVAADAVLMYWMAVILNAVLGLFSLLIAYRLLCRMKAKSEELSETAVWAFTAVSFSAYIFNSYIAWSETLLSFLVWLLLYELVLLEENPKGWKGILFGVTAGYSYMVHNRMLAVAAAVLIVIGLLFWKKKVSLYLFPVTALFFATAFQCMRLTIRGENDYTQQYAEIFDFLKENTEAEEPVFTLTGGKFAYDLQTRLADKMVICIEEEQIPYVADSQYLVMPEQAYGNFADPAYTACL